MIIAQPASRYRWYALLLLACAYMFQSVDRQIVSVVIEPIKHAFHASDLAMGFLGGFAYTTAFAVACLPAGWLVDRLNRRVLLTVLLAVWSGLTLTCGLAGSFVGLVLMRMGVGAAEAGAQPACISLISDFFGPRERSTVIGYFYLSTAIGITISFLMGGIVAAHFGWRGAFFVAGPPGLLVACVIGMTLREPVRGRFDGGRPDVMAPRAVVAHLRGEPALLHLAVGMTLSALTITAMWLWTASLLIRVHGVALSHAGVILAVASIAAALGSVTAGRLADWAAGADYANLMLVPVITSLAAAPFGIGLAYAPDLALAIFCLIGLAFLTGGFWGPCYSLAMWLVPPAMRGMTAAAMQMLVNLLGAGVGPILLGEISDFFGGALSLRPALAMTMTFNLWAAVHFFLSYRAMRSRSSVSGINLAEPTTVT